MTDSSIACLQCGQSNSSHRLWCEKCGTATPQLSTPPFAVEDPSAHERTQLYQRILKDLEQLWKDQKVNRESYDAIKACYEEQLAQIDEQATARNQSQRRHRLVLTARQAAHSGRFQDAITYFGQALAADPGEHRLEQAIAEVKAKFEQREKALQATRQADALLRESKVSLAEFRLEEAENKLEQAKRLTPNSGQITTALKQVRAQIAAQKARELAEKIPPEHEEPDKRAVLPATSAHADPESQRVPPGTTRVETSLDNVSFAEDHQELPNPRHRLIEAASQWSSIVKPFLLDNVGWFVGAFLVVAGFVVLIVSFWGSIEQNRILMHSLVYISLAVATGMFFAAAYFMRLKYPQLENSSNVLFVIVALLIPLVFAAAILTAFIPATLPDVAHVQGLG